MSQSVYASLFRNLMTLIPGLADPPCGAHFCVPYPHLPDVLLSACIIAREGDMCLLVLTESQLDFDTLQPASVIRLRIDLASQLAEILEYEDLRGLLVVYADTRTIHPRRIQINLAGNDWLQALIGFNLIFRLIAVPAAA
jgi:hypothetical protein